MFFCNNELFAGRIINHTRIEIVIVLMPAATKIRGWTAGTG
jgi:hypothetical protein